MSMVDDIVEGLFDGEDDLPEVPKMRPAVDGSISSRPRGWMSDGERALVREREAARIRMDDAEARLLAAERRRREVNDVAREEFEREADRQAMEIAGARQRDEDVARAMMNEPARPNPNDPANWTPEQRAVAGLGGNAVSSVSPVSPVPNEWDSAAEVRRWDEAASQIEENRARDSVNGWGPNAAPALAARPVRRSGASPEVESDRANRFRSSAELERAMRTAQRAAEVLSEAEALVARAKELAKKLEDADAFRDAEELEEKLQAIEDSIEGIGG